MSVNRFEITLPMLCTTPDALPSQIDAYETAALILDIRKDWATGSAADEVQAVLTQRQSTAGSTLFRVGKPDDEAGQSAVERLVALRPHARRPA